MPIEYNGSSTSITGNAINFYQVLTLKSAIGLYLETGMFAIRGLTVTYMLKLANQYTGKVYKRGKTGLTEALADLSLITAGKHPDSVVPDGNQLPEI